ncbi:arginase family protein [Bacillus methanolicus]|uniref:arginase family protein n=1 Tax=Bacillus methanolicus TaxID=1471 RepID=UPI00200CDB65|nr:arginase family protein [Bacillus methanolicus]UQD50966.1 arginase family protein [Bacillus methanolicus]
MGLLNKGVTFLNFDETYFSQQSLRSIPHESIDFLNLQHVHLFCEKDSLKEIERRLSERKQKGITFIGNGNYHYVTYLLLKEIHTPFTLVLFDNHPDIDMSEGTTEKIISCGSWVSFALEHIPMMKQVIIVGPSSAKIASSESLKVTIFPFDRQQNYSSKLILSTIQTDTVYISIDKDVLNKSDAVTNWDQGFMNIHTLIQYVQDILKNKDIYGVDICGEAPSTPNNFFLPTYKDSIQKNETANIKILQTCLGNSRQKASERRIHSFTSAKFTAAYKGGVRMPS